MSQMSRECIKESDKRLVTKSLDIVIAISGTPGSGKSTCARKLAEIYKLRYISAGKLFRQIAEEKGLSLEDLHKLAEQNYEIDKYVDRRTLLEAKKGNAVIEGHLTAWILKDIADVKIFLKASLEERARRVSRRDNISVKEAKEKIIFREQSNRQRFLKIYGIDISDWSIFDLIIDTTNIPPDAVIKIISTYISYYMRP